MLKEAIRENWTTDIAGYAQELGILSGSAYPAWTVRFDTGYGVAIPYTGTEDIYENFAGARIRSTTINFQNGSVQRAIVLTTDADEIEAPFAALCEALVDPGENGTLRHQLEESPLSWWKEWKELLGNRNIDERIYDVLGELCVLKYAVTNGEEAVWNGPSGSSYDIETDERFLEVKSTINRDKKEVTISSQFQLFPPEKPLNLVLCVFEPAILSGISIDGLLQDFSRLGYNTSVLNSKLEAKGFEQGMSARKRTFLLHDMLLYRVDASFPRISPASFPGGVLPAGITKISYTVDLSGLSATSLIQGAVHDI